MSESAPDRSPPERYDPVFLHARREGILILCVWLTCLVWCIGYCVSNGYYDPAAAGAAAAAGGHVAKTMGMPRWIFWGVLVPWAAATVFTVTYSLYFMKSDDLGQEADASIGEAADD